MIFGHEYSEKSARAKLSRHRKRGENNVHMVCIDGRWYVGEYDPCPECAGWGGEYANGFDGTTRPCRKCRGKAVETGEQDA